MVIDGHSLAYRAFFATLSQLEYAQKNDLRPNNAIRTMIMMINRILKLKQYQYGLVTFDTSRKSFRTELFADYKANRKPMPESLVSQMGPIIDSLPYFGFKVLSLEKYESDDLIGTFARICTENEVTCDIFSSDNDFLQLVNPYTSVNILEKGTTQIKIYHHQNFQELTGGLEPAQIIDVKSLSGDASDNYKGVPGIGPTTAKSMILKYGSIQELLNNINQLSPNHQAKITPYQNQIELFIQLATIKKNVEINPDLTYYYLDALSPDQELQLDQFLAE